MPETTRKQIPPGIRELKSTEMSSENFEFCTQKNGTNKLNLGAEIDTSPPFGSVKEAVNKFGGSGSWMPYYKGFADVDIKKVEEQAAELEKDLIVKELETLDVLEELGTTKKIVEDLKRQLQREALRFMTNQFPGLTSKFAGVLSLEELKQARLNSPIAGNLGISYLAEQPKKVAETENSEAPKLKWTNVQSRSNLQTAELRLLAAKKMEEAARTAEAVALAEMKFLSSNDSTAVFAHRQPEKFSPFGTRAPLNPKAHKLQGIPQNKIEIPKIQKHDTKTSALKRLRGATEEVKLSKQALEEALNKLEMAIRKQYAAEEALRKWIPEDHQEGSQAAYYASRLSNFHHQDFQLNELRVDIPSEERKPASRSTVSMQDVLSSRKQVLPEDYVAAKPTEARNERKKVALSQMLHELRGHEQDGGEQKQLYTIRRKFGFIHISLPMTKLSKKKEARFD